MTTFNKKSFYSNTGASTFFRGYYEPVKLPRDVASDETIVISSEYHRRPGKMAQDVFGDVSLVWVFAIYNKDLLTDPIYDFVEGLEITVPNADRLKRLI